MGGNETWAEIEKLGSALRKLDMTKAMTPEGEGESLDGLDLGPLPRGDTFKGIGAFVDVNASSPGGDGLPAVSETIISSDDRSVPQQFQDRDVASSTVAQHGRSDGASQLPGLLNQRWMPDQGINGNESFESMLRRAGAYHEGPAYAKGFEPPEPTAREDRAGKMLKSVDDYLSDLVEKDPWAYSTGSPNMPVLDPRVATSYGRECPTMKKSYPAYLTSCPHCGHDHGASNGPAVHLSKGFSPFPSGRPRTPQLFFADGVIPLD